MRAKPPHARRVFMQQRPAHPRTFADASALGVRPGRLSAPYGVGYHILAHLALHWWLRKRKRPVPVFLILDQPTQAYYPPDRVDGGLDQIDKDADRVAVLSLFRLMYLACQEIERPFQLIVLDHAHIREDWFEASIIEEWRDDNALVPRTWSSSGTTRARPIRRV